jgi:hypothetical protein
MYFERYKRRILYDIEKLYEKYTKVSIEKRGIDDNQIIEVYDGAQKYTFILYKNKYPFFPPGIFIGEKNIPYKEYIITPQKCQYICLYCNTYVNPKNWNLNVSLVDIIKQIQNVGRVKRDILLHYLCDKITKKNNLCDDIFIHICTFIFPVLYNDYECAAI